MIASFACPYAQSAPVRLSPAASAGPAGTRYFFVLRTRCQWKALSATGICSSSTAHSRFQAWVQAGVFIRLWDEALHDYEDLIGLDFDWMVLDSSLHKAPLGGKKRAPTPRTAAKAASSAAC